jgi:Glycosyltransferase family 9 (heptosyltransferase)
VIGWGDEIMASGQAQRAYEANPAQRVAICDGAGRARWHVLWNGNPILAMPVAVRRGEMVTRITNAPGARPYLRYPFTHATGWRFTGWRANDHRGRIYLTPHEREMAARLRAQLGAFVVVEPCLSADSNPNKAWIWDRWEALVRTCTDIQFVQCLHADSRVLPGARTVTTASFRDACALLELADGLVTTEGGLHHAAAALWRPAVVIFGGCASVQITGYDGHRNLADTGPETPCGRYLPCAHCRDAMARIAIEDVASAVRRMTAGVLTHATY